MIKHTLSVAYTEVTGIDNLSEDDRTLLNKAWVACESAYAPYSNFHVGASLRLANDLIYTGNNQENAAYPSGICAERVAVFSASAMHPGVAIKSIAVVAKTKVFDLVDSRNTMRSLQAGIGRIRNSVGRAYTYYTAREFGQNMDSRWHCQPVALDVSWRRLKEIEERMTTVTK